MSKKLKKDLKEFINKNGFWLQINSLEKIEKNDFNLSENSIRTKAELPSGENIIMFRGTATQKFEKGKASRNEYKIDIKGWDWSNYLLNPTILLQHDSDMPIGKCLEIIPKQNGIDIVYFVDLKTMNEQDAHRVENGFFSALSTGHITHELKFEDPKTGKLYSKSELKKYCDENNLDYYDIVCNVFIPVVTKAEAVEISQVAIGSNPKALTTRNSIKNFLKNSMKIKENGEVQAGDAKTNENEINEVDTNEEQETEQEDKKDNENSDTPENDGVEEEETEADDEVETSENDDEETETKAEEVIEPNSSKQKISVELKQELANEIAKKQKELAELEELDNSLVAENKIKENTLINEMAKNQIKLENKINKQGEELKEHKNAIKELCKIVDNIPNLKGNKLTNQFAPKITTL